jgi:signal transduction histidine kinase
VTVSDEPAGAALAPATDAPESERVRSARTRAQQRLLRQRATLRPLGLAIALLVIAASASSHPPLGLQGKGLAVTMALCIFAGGLAVATRGGFPNLRQQRQADVIIAMGAAGVALAGLQPHGASEIAGSVAVFMAVVRLNAIPGLVVGSSITAALAIVLAVTGSAAATVLAAVLLSVLLGIVARFIKQARESQDRTEMLLAQLEDAREEQARAAALAERGRIATELHDVLAHSLSGAAIQLQGARLTAERDGADAKTRDAVDRASELVKSGLADARQAVGALRGEELPNLAQLERLITSFREDMNVHAMLTIAGTPRALPAETSLAFYRGAQEALTNVARYAPGARTTVVLRYGPETTRLTIENGAVHAATGILGHIGGGRGLAGMRERIERRGGVMRAGPSDNGWLVELEVPA